MFSRASTGETMRARRGPLIKAIPAGFRVFFDGARWARTGRCLAALAETENAPGEDGGHLTAAFGRDHGGRIVQRAGHCGLLADVPTTACPLGPARCLAGSRIPYWLYTRREFELSVGSGTNGVVNSPRQTEEVLAHSSWNRPKRWANSSLSGCDRTYVGRMLRLTSLAPDIIEAILRGDDPDGLSLEKLRKNLPLRWEEQRECWD